MGYTSFESDIKRGKVGELIFKEDFLEFLNINYKDVTGCQKFQVIDSDFKATIGLYEIKTNYKDDNHIIIEEYSDYPKLDGWWYKTRADLIVFISKVTKNMILLPINDKVKEYYESIKNGFELRFNKRSIGFGGLNSWQSAFRIISLEVLKGFYSKYKRIK